MSHWIETYRGAVTPWECDIVEHLTIAYYFDRFSDANLALFESVGMGMDYRQRDRMSCAAVHCHVRFMQELAVGDVLHIESGVLGVEDKFVRTGQKVYNSATGEVTATMEQTLIHIDLDRRKVVPVPPERRQALLERRVEWDGPAREERPEPEGTEGFIDAARDTVKPWEIDVIGHLGFQFYIHRGSAASAQMTTAFGMTPEYVRNQRRGVSTFEIDIRFRRELNAGDLVAVKTGLVHVGTSSFRMLHKLFNAGTGELSAVMSQFCVQLDMDARRPAPFPDEIRRRARAMLAPMAAA